MSFKKCSFCGEEMVPASADFCISCGRPLNRIPDQVAVIKVIHDPSDERDFWSTVKHFINQRKDEFFAACAILAVGLGGILYVALNNNQDLSESSIPKSPTPNNAKVDPEKALADAYNAMVNTANKSPGDGSTSTKEDRARRKKEGVRVGMTKDEVLASSWGKPRDVNTTTTAFGTHEQWVYGLGSYLYFENGVLTSIQN